MGSGEEIREEAGEGAGAESGEGIGEESGEGFGEERRKGMGGAGGRKVGRVAERWLERKLEREFWAIALGSHQLGHAPPPPLPASPGELRVYRRRLRGRPRAAQAQGGRQAAGGGSAHQFPCLGTGLRGVL